MEKKKNPNTTDQDKETHPVLGMTYRVNIRTTRNGQIHERLREEAHDQVENLKKAVEIGK